MKGFDGVKEKMKGKRDWVKNAAIIFLVILLILTFFSNTIMNHSLPEVAAQYPVSDSITSKVRGSGTIEATQSYNVTLQETRTVAQVNVRAGDTVKEGDVLIKLDSMESEELTQARLDYNNLKLEYDKMAVQSGAKTNVSDEELRQAAEAVTKAQEDLAKAQSYESSLKAYESAVSAAQSNLTAKQQASSNADTALQLLQNKRENYQVTDTRYLTAKQRVTAADAEVKRLEGIEPDYSDDPVVPEPSTEPSPEPSEEPEPSASPSPSPEPSVSPEPVEDDGEAYITATESEEHRQWQILYDAAVAEQTAAKDNLDQVAADIEFELDQQIAAAQVTQINAAAAATQAATALSQAQEALSNFQTQNPDAMSVSAAQAALDTAQNAYDTLVATQADEAVQSDYDGQVSQIELDAKYQEMMNAKDKLDALEENASAIEIVSRYSGVVTAVNVAAGDKTSADQPLIVVDLTEQGYTLTSTVTKQQAKLLQVGQEAEITNLWDSGITMTLTSVTTDKDNPTDSRVLTFLLTGEDISVGQSVTYSIGNKNASYDTVIPTAAIHTDSSGSFVYILNVTSSPLGSRYSVAKKTVTIVASDDTNSAVTGDLTTDDFVITTSAVPLTEGEQVRIADNG